MNYIQMTLEAVSRLATEHNISDLEMITKLQVAACKIGDEKSLETLCGLKSILLGF
jgi:hypothetical protein